ncbi:MAG: carbonic anhydrase family protein [Prochloraceae cyanobacterium]|nr:carbonic anhydrase family protein [Prochloraceae cyanobacterium]
MSWKLDLYFKLSLITIATFYPFYLCSAEENDSRHWDYGGAWNPTRWSELKPEYALCENGRNQSPINLVPYTAEPISDSLEFKYRSIPVSILNNGHTVQINFLPGSYILVNGEKYELQQLHFHTPSEHTVMGKASAGELHLLHKNPAGKTVVILVFLREGKYNQVLGALREYIPKQEGENQIKGVGLDVNQLLPTQMDSYYYYSGSLTTPPCTENVNWYVMTTPIEVSSEQIERFRSLYQVNARPIQPLNGRVIYFKK